MVVSCILVQDHHLPSWLGFMAVLLLVWVMKDNKVICMDGVSSEACDGFDGNENA